MELLILLDVKASSLVNEFVKKFYTSEWIDSYVTGLTWGTVAIAEALAVIFYLIALGWNFASNTFKKQNKTIVNIGEIARTLVLMFTIGLYPWVMGFIMQISGILVNATEKLSDKTQLAKYEQYMNYRLKSRSLTGVDEFGTDSQSLQNNNYNLDNQQTSGIDNSLNTSPMPDNGPANGKGESSSWTSFFDVLGNPLTVLAFIINTVTFLIAALIKMVISILLGSIIKVLFILGPLAIAFSILPFMQDKFAHFINIYLNCVFCFVTMNILDAVLIHQMYGAFNQYLSGTTDTGILATTAMDISIIFLYISIFWLTSVYVGSDSAGKVISNGLNAMQTAAQMAIAGAVAPKVMDALEGEGSVGDAAKVGKDAIAQN